MSIFGKVLAVLNILAAVAFVIFAGMSYGPRKAWAYTAYMHEMALTGLPLNKEERDVDGTPLHEKPTENTLSQLLRNPVVRTQEEALNRRKSDLRAEIDGLADDSAKRQRLEQLLLPALPTKQTGGDRDELRRRIREDKIDVLLGDDGPFERAFTEALSPSLSVEERRQAIAYLLIALAEDPSERGKPEHENTARNLRWVLNVVGARHYTKAMEEHGLNLRRLEQRVRDGIIQDQSDFIQTHDRRVLELVRIANQIEDLKRQRERLRDQKEKDHDALVSAQTNKLKALEKERDDLEKKLTGDPDKKDTGEAGKQLDYEQRLFRKQREFGMAAERNLELEREIRNLEKKVTGDLDKKDQERPR